MNENRDSVIAVVLTYRRPKLATQVVRGLLDKEGFDASEVLLVVNGEGGLDDAELERQIHVQRLPKNLGPAGGFRAGLQEAARRGYDWAYLCEDDVGLFDLPTPRVAPLMERIGQSPHADRIGGVVAYGRRLDHRTGRTKPHVPGAADPDLVTVDAAAWGASLVRCDIVRQGILPDPDLFFGFEDFDFWYSAQRAGWSVLLDSQTARAVASRVFHEQRERQLSAQRPTDDQEPWRRYYEARNFMALRRRFGHTGWTIMHVLLTLRRMQLSPTWQHRRASIHGLVDGVRGRSGKHPRYQRGLGEHGASRQLRVLHVITDNDRRGGQVFATDLARELTAEGLENRVVALAPARGGLGLGHWVLGPRRRHPSTVLALRRAMRSSDVVIAHGSTTLPMCAVAGLAAGVPFVYRQISQQQFWVRTYRQRWQTRMALRRATRVVALWSGAADLLETDFAVDRSRIDVIPNGVPAGRCPVPEKADVQDARTKFGLDPERLVVLSLGALVPEKGVDRLAEAMQSLELRGWQLLVVGAGSEEARLRRYADRLKSGTIVFHPPVSSGSEAIAAADVVALLSRGGDSMPAVLIEAALMGVPVVATPVEGIVDIIREGETGFLVSGDDQAMVARAVVEAERDAERLGTLARDRALSLFEIRRVADLWANTIREAARVGTASAR